jgi:hypothetical protein
MSGFVPPRRAEISPAQVLVGANVSSGQQWLPAGSGTNWLAGKGAVMVPTHIVDKSILAGATGVLRYRVKPRYAAIERVWTLMLRTGTLTGVSAVVRAPAGTGTAMTVTVPTGRALRMPIIYREILSAQSDTVGDLTIGIAVTGGDVEIDSISCFDLDRSGVEEGLTEHGTDTMMLRPRERIYDGGPFTNSVTGVLFGSALADARRVGIYHWAVPDIYPVTTAAAGPTSLLTLACPVLGPIYNSGATTASVWWSAYCKVSAGTSTVKLSTTQSGVNDVASITGTSYAWTTAREIFISCEDPTAADGLRSSAFDDLSILLTATGGTLSLLSVCVWNEESYT